MNKKMVLFSMLVASSAYAMDGVRLQIVSNTPVAKVIQWISSGTTEANVAAVAVAVCVAKPALEIATWPVRTWWGWRKDNLLRQELLHMNERLALLGTQFDDQKSVTVQSENQGGEASDSGTEIAVLRSDVQQLAAKPEISSAEFARLQQRVTDLENAQREVAAFSSRLEVIEKAQSALETARSSVSPEVIEAIQQRLIRIEGGSGQSNAGSVEGLSSEHRKILIEFAGVLANPSGASEQAQGKGSQGGEVHQKLTYFNMVAKVAAMGIDLDKLKKDVGYIEANYARKQVGVKQW